MLLIYSYFKYDSSCFDFAGDYEKLDNEVMRDFHDFPCNYDQPPLLLSTKNNNLNAEDVNCDADHKEEANKMLTSEREEIQGDFMSFPLLDMFVYSDPLYASLDILPTQNNHLMQGTQMYFTFSFFIK